MITPRTSTAESPMKNPRAPCVAKIRRATAISPSVDSIEDCCTIFTRSNGIHVDENAADAAMPPANTADERSHERWVWR